MEQTTNSGAVVVTGAAQGIGYAIAERFAALGQRVVIADLRGSEAAAQKLGGSLNEKMRVAAPVRWLNYLAPGDSFPSLDFHLALVAPERTFHDRLVVIGSRSTLSGVGMGKDDFRNPYNLLGGAFSTGAEVHTTALLNLLHGDWMNRLNPRWEVWLVTGIGLFLGGVLPRFRPHTAALLAAGSIAGIVTLAWWLLAMHRIWFAWGVAALVLVPAALVWAVGARYFIEERRRSALRDGFGHYLPAHIVDRIADSDFDLAPGGAVCEASVLFTDLEGFTALSENLQSPELVTSILLKYFAQTSQPILENDGLILNFVGDAMTAVWGVPLATADHAKRATMAAWQLHQSAHIDIGGRTLRTRVGLHTGKVLAGNVGSAKRFDYAVIGDPANLASRLEGLNKFLGTDVLISEAIRALVADSFTTRCVGEFRVLGKKEACRVHELLGPASSEKPAAWEDSFADALRAFGAGNLPAAEIGMSKTLAERGGTDGPSQFYLRHIARLKGTELPPDWTGVIEFTEK